MKHSSTRLGCVCHIATVSNSIQPQLMSIIDDDDDDDDDERTTKFSV